MNDDIEFCPLTKEDCTETCAWWEYHTECCSMRSIAMFLRDVFGKAYDIVEHLQEKKEEL
jgi:hypothetical protein